MSAEPHEVPPTAPRASFPYKGGSGSGKTSLLNCLAMRLPPYGYDTKGAPRLPASAPARAAPRGELSLHASVDRHATEGKPSRRSPPRLCPGEILYNGLPATAEIRERTGYVLQTDFLLIHLTVRCGRPPPALSPAVSSGALAAPSQRFGPLATRRETLTFASRLRLPTSYPRELKRARVEARRTQPQIPPLSSPPARPYPRGLTPPPPRPARPAAPPPGDGPQGLRRDALRAHLRRGEAPPLHRGTDGDRPDPPLRRRAHHRRAAPPRPPPTARASLRPSCQRSFSGD